jgi:hypothetical protein
MAGALVKPRFYAFASNALAASGAQLGQLMRRETTFPTWEMGSTQSLRDSCSFITIFA